MPDVAVKKMYFFLKFSELLFSKAFRELLDCIDILHKGMNKAINLLVILVYPFEVKTD